MLDRERLIQYQDLYADEGVDALPPVTVFFDDTVYWVADGFHRVEALRTLKQRRPDITHVPVDLRQGSKRDAILFACGANAKHGKPLAYSEKRSAVQRLLADEEWSQWSNRAIARHVGVGRTL